MNLFSEDVTKECTEKYQQVGGNRLAADTQQIETQAHT